MLKGDPMAKFRNPYKKTCPFKDSIECLQFEPIMTDPRREGMSDLQMKESQVDPTTPVFRCTECGAVWYESGGFARPVGWQDPGGRTGFQLATPEQRRNPKYLG
jgi:hypothetical protein